MVMALRNPPELADAVRSLVTQSVQAHVVVVNSGGGGAAASLRAAGLDIQVIECCERLLPGGARNLGIGALSTPFIAFLASDCIAEPGWVASRLRRHRAGALAVASSVTNANPHSVIAWTSYISLFSTRAPGVPESLAPRYGASYARTLFERFGGFRDDLRGGEDTDFHARFAASEPIVWAADVRTAHRHPLTLRGLVADQFRRGARAARAWRQLNGPSPERVAMNALRRAPRQLRISWRHAERGQRMRIAMAALLVPLAATAYAAGALSLKARIVHDEH